MSYAGSTPLYETLGVGAGMRVGLDDPPAEFVGLTLMPVPEGVRLHTRIAGNMDVVLGFYEQRADLERRLPVLRRRIPDTGCLWIAWPASSTHVPTDVSPEVISELAAPLGLTPTDRCALDHAWAGQKLVVTGQMDDA